MISPPRQQTPAPRALWRIPLQRAGAWARASAREVLRRPFQGELYLTTNLTPALLDRARRGAFLQLLLLCVLAVALVVLLPAALLGHAETASLVRLALVTALAASGLALNWLGYPYSAGSLFIFGTIAVVIHFILTNPAGLDVPAILTYALFSVLILMVGLILPVRLIWVIAGLIILTTLAGVFLMPLAPLLRPLAPDPLALRFAVAGPLVVLHLFVALFSWLAGRGATAGEQAATRALERERELTALKDQFILAANHELRTPIMALYGNIEVLASLGKRATPEQRERLVQRALVSGDAVLKLLNIVLDTGAIESSVPRVSPRPVALAPLVTDVLQTFDPREIGESGMDPITAEKQRPVRVDMELGTTVFADEARLRQVLVNLVSNAVKYSPAGSPIVITARPSATIMRGATVPRVPLMKAHAGYIRISVRDEGLGVPPRDAPKLFNRFVRLERDIAGTVRGTGLGLYLCRTLVEAMGGRIWVESSGVPGEGSTFSFTLPGAHPALRETAAEVAVLRV